MPIQCQQDQLSKILSTVSTAIATRTLVPIMENVLIEAGADGLTMTASNAEFSVSAWLDIDLAHLDAPFRTTIPARKLLDTVALMPAGEVSLSLAGFNLALQGGKLKMRLLGVDSQYYPAVPVIDPTDVSIVLPVATLLSAINSIAFNAATEQIAPVLTGLKIQLENSQDGEVLLSVVATDGFRMGVRECVMSHASIEPMEVIVPSRSLQIFARIARNMDGDATLAFHGSNLIIQAGNISFSAQTLNGKFSDYKHAMPTTYKTTFVALRSELIRAFSMAQVIAQDISHTVQLDINPATKTLRLKAISSSSGENDGAVDLVDAQGSALTIGASSRLMLEALERLETDQVKMSFNISTSPMLMTPEPLPAGDQAWQYLMGAMKPG